MKTRREKYTPKVHLKNSRHSEKHLFSSLIKCAHCGRSFYQKHYTYINTRYYWKCQTNDRFTSEKCDNRVTITEGDLLEEIRIYLESLIEDKEEFIQNILTELKKDRVNPLKSIDQSELQKNIKRLQLKREKYQEMYAAEVMTMAELKEKSSYINNEIETLTKELKKIKFSKDPPKTSIDQIQIYKKEIEKFLSFDNITNGDLRKIINYIIVKRNGEITIHLRDISDFMIA